VIVGGFFLSVDSSIYVVAVVDKGRKENLVVVGRRTKEGKKERRNGGMEEWKEIGFCTTTTYYCYYYILLLIPLSTCYLLLLQLPVLCLYAIREFSRWTSNGIWDIYNLLFSMVFIIIINLLA